MTRVRFVEPARLEVLAEVGYYYRVEAGLGTKFLEAVEDTIARDFACPLAGSPAQHIHVTSAQVITGHSLLLQFDDGTHGEVDLAAELTGPFFEELLDPERFKEAYLDPQLCTVCWPYGADLAAEFLGSLVLQKQLV